MYFNKRECENQIKIIQYKCYDAVSLLPDFYGKNLEGLCFYASYELFKKLSLNPGIRQDLSFCIGEGHAFLKYKDIIIDPTIKQIHPNIKNHILTHSELNRLKRYYKKSSWHYYDVLWQSNNADLILNELKDLTLEQQPLFVNKLLMEREQFAKVVSKRIYDDLVNDKIEQLFM